MAAGRRLRRRRASSTAAIEHLYLARAILEALAIEIPERLRVTIHFDD